VKAREKAEKAVPKAETALEKARVTLREGGLALEEAERGIEDSRSAVTAANLEKLSAPTVPEHVSAITPRPDVSAFEDQLPDSYQQRKATRPHESPWTMTLPLAALAGLALVGGLLNLPFTSDLHYLEHWLEPSLFGNEAHVDASAGTKWLLAVIATVVAIGAVVAAFAVYLKERTRPAEIERPELGLAMRWDAALAAFMGGPGRRLFQGAADFDATVVDRAVDGVAGGVQSIGQGLKATQPGFVRQYALGILLGVAAVGLWFLTRLWA